MSDTHEVAVAEPASDADAPGEEDDEDVEMAVDSDSSDDVDAEGEADGDYDSESPPPEQAESDDARSSVSQESSRPSKRKASPEGDDYITQNPELYGLRRSGRARPHRRVVDSSDEDDDSSSDVPRKRQRTASRKGVSFHQLPSRVVLIHRHSV
jgi:chromodomain-helicase-DNA-binding protein 1